MFVAVLVTLAALIVSVLPIVSAVKILRMRRELDDMRARLDRFERAAQVAPIERSLSPRRGLTTSPTESAPAAVPISLARAEPVPPSPADAGDPERIERQIGERLLLYAGMVVLVLGVAFFLRYAFEREWLSPLVRVLLGGVAGAAFIVGGRRLARAGYRQYGLFLCGGGLAVLFLSAYASFALYGLIGRVPAFALLALIAAGAALLADREASLPLAFMAVCGGFATPFLVGGRGDAQITLFTYDAILVAVTMYLAKRRQWPALNLASLFATVATVMAWGAAFYTPDKYLRTEAFLTLYCAMFAFILREGLRDSRWKSDATTMLWSAPVLYHVASLLILAEHGAALLVYVIAAAVVVVIVSTARSSSWLRLTGWAAIVLPFIVWIAAHASRGLVVGSVVAASGVWLLFLLAQARQVRDGDALDSLDTVLLHANGLGVFVALYSALQPFATSGQLALVAAACAAASAVAWAAARGRGTPAALHWLAVAGSLSAIAVAVAFDGPWIVVMWAAEGAAVTWMGQRLDRRWFRRAGLALMLLAVVRWLAPDVQQRGAAIALLMNSRALSGAAIVACLYVQAWILARLLRPPSATEQRARAGDVVLERAIVLVAASALTVIIVSTEIQSYWTSANGRDDPLARSLLLSAWWAAYAAALVAVGMRRHYAPIRYFAMVLFALTLVKAFVVDLQQLGGLYRVIGFVVVGGILLLVSFLYQRSRFRPVRGDP